MTIDDVYKRRINYYREYCEYPKLFLVSEEERNELITEVRLLTLREITSISNLYFHSYPRYEELKLFNIIISTEERERKTKC